MEDPNEEKTDEELKKAICLDVARWNQQNSPCQRTILVGVVNGLIHGGLVERYAVTDQGLLFVELADGRLLRMSVKLYGSPGDDPATSVIGYNDLCWKTV